MMLKHSSHTKSRSRYWVTSFIMLLVAFRSKPFLQIPLKVFTQSGRKHKCLEAIFNLFFLVAILFDLIFRDIDEICGYLIISVPETHRQIKPCGRKKKRLINIVSRRVNRRIFSTSTKCPASIILSASSRTRNRRLLISFAKLSS